MTHSHIDLGWELTGEELDRLDARAMIDEIERLAEADIDTSWVDDMFDRFESERDEGAYPFDDDEELAIVEAEIARLEQVASRIDPDLIDNLIDEARLNARYERRADLKGGGH